MGIISRWKAKRAAKKSGTSTSSTSSGGGTYYSGSGTYVSSSGQGSSVATAPKGSTISSGKDPNIPSSSGGGGSYSSSTGTYTSPTGEKQSMAQSLVPTGTKINIAKDTPSSYQGVVDVFTPTTGIKSGYSYLKDKWKYDKIGAIKGAVQISFGKEKALKEKLYSGIGKGEEKASAWVSKAFPSGVAEQQFDKAVTSFNTRTENLNQDIKDYETEVEKYPEGAPQGVYEKLKTKEKELNQRIENQQTTYQNIEEAGKEIKTGKKWKLEKLFRGTTLGVVSAIAFIPKFITRPVKTTEETITGIGQLPSQLKDQPLMTIGGVLGSIATFYVGGKIVGRVVGGKPVDPVKLDSALKTAEVKPVRTTGIVKESEIKAYGFEAGVEAKLLSNIKAGNSVKVTEWKIEGASSSTQKVINKGIPRTKIVSIDVVDSVGNVIGRKSFVGVQVKKGLMKYREYTTGEGVGIYDPITKTIKMETTFVKGKPSKPPSEIYKEFDVIKAEKPITTAERMRITRGKSLTFEGLKKVATKEKPLTYKDLLEVVKSEKRAKYPSRTGKVAEVQELKSLKKLEGEITIDQKPFLNIIGMEKVLKVKKIGTKTSKLPKPFEFKTKPSKAFKTFETKPIEFKQPEIPKLNKKQVEILKQGEIQYPKMVGGKGLEVLDYSSLIGKRKITREGFDIGMLPEYDFTNQISSNLRSIAKRTRIEKPTISTTPITAIDLKTTTSPVLTGLSSAELERRLKRLRKTSRTSTTQIVKPTVKLGQPQRLVQPQIMTPKQVNLQIAKLQQVQPQRITHPFKPKVPKFETPFSFMFPHKKETIEQIRRRNLQAKRKKPTPKYTASLGAAAFQAKPIKVSRKEFERLSKVTFTGIETRPILQISEDEKKIKKQLEKVNF